MTTHSAFPRLLLPLLLAWLAALPPRASAKAPEAERHVRDAQSTFSNFMRDPNMTWLQENIANARAVLIVPRVVRAGFIFGGSGGRGVLVARDESGQWVGPAFYTLGTASVGFQAGVQVSEVVIVVMTQKGLDGLLASTIRVGPDAAIAAGPVGAGVKADVMADLVSFSRSKGLYGGLNLNGSVISANYEWNQGYYEQPVTPVDILVRKEVSSKQAARLLELVGDAAAGTQR